MRALILVSIALLALTGFSGDNKPKPGETWLHLKIEKRGEVDIQLFTKEAPKATGHIVELADKAFYNNQRIFRVDKQPRPFLVLFGDPQTREKPMGDPSLGSGGSGAEIPYEDSGFTNKEGYVGLATPPRQRDKGDSQFYILLGTHKFLDGQYTVFGKVLGDGMDVVKKLEVGDKVTSVTILRGPKR